MKFTGWKANNEKEELEIPLVNATHVAHLHRYGRIIDIWYANGIFYRQIAVKAISQQVKIDANDHPENWSVHKDVYGNYIFLIAYETEPFFGPDENSRFSTTKLITSLQTLVNYADAKSIPESVLSHNNEWALSEYFKFDPLETVQKLEKSQSKNLTLSYSLFRTYVESNDTDLYELLKNKFGRMTVELLDQRILVHRGAGRISFADIKAFLEESGYTVSEE